MSAKPVGKWGRRALVITEAMTAIVILIAVALALVGTAFIVYQAARQGLNVTNARSAVIDVLDLTVLMLLATDLLRTIERLLSEGTMPLRSVVEIGGLVIVREMIAASLQSLQVISQLELAGALAIIVTAYVVLVKYFPRD